MTVCEDSKSDDVTSQFGVQEIIKEASHIIGDFSSGINLIWTTQPNFSYRIWSSFFATRKLPSPYNVCKIQP